MATGPQLVTAAASKPASARDTVLAEISELRTDFWRRLNELETRVLAAFADDSDTNPQDAA
jgi:hypothetical protein